MKDPATSANPLKITGARENNLKNISVSLPRNKLIVFTGVSGSGKSSLAFDTIFAEGQMRYVESLSSYARQFLDKRGKPDVDSIEGLSPAIAISQRGVSANPRSTVATTTEIYDYMRLLWARVGIAHCPECGKEIEKLSVDQITQRLMAMQPGTKFSILAPVIRGKKGDHKELLSELRSGGYVRARIDGAMADLTGTISLSKNKKHNIDVYIDRLVLESDIRSRLTDACETAMNLAHGLVLAQTQDTEILFSENWACPDCEIELPELSPRLFSFNTPYGACPQCDGLGYFYQVDPERVVGNSSLSLSHGAIAASGWRSASKGTISCAYYQALGEKFGFTVDTPWEKISQEGRDAILFGTQGEKMELEYYSYGGQFMHNFKSFEGIVSNLTRRYQEQQSDESRAELEKYMTSAPCQTCHGDRLSNVVLGVTVGGKNISDFCKFSIAQASDFLNQLQLDGSKQLIARTILSEIHARLNFLQKVGLSYLTLSRLSQTLSGGESQRLRLATQIGSGLRGVLYVLDEPSIGLHQRDTQRLLASLEELRDLGNTLIVIEHDPETIRRADWIVDFGPNAGRHGGKIIASGVLETILANQESLTGQYLSGTRATEKKRRQGNGHMLNIFGAAQNNLKNVNVSFPLGKLICVTGVSGSGKSSLVNDILYSKLAFLLNRSNIPAGKHEKMEGVEFLDKVIGIDQSPIGRTPRSNPATYTGFFSDIRDLFSKTTDAQERGYGPGRFSFNVKGGRCESCKGDGMVQIEMQFLPTVYVPCATCHGARYNRETLEVRLKGKNIAEVLNMTCDEANEFFANYPALSRKLKTICDVGLGYIQLGQSSTTLSGGEAQRVKLATQLLRPSTGSTLYVLDEPTTGLHMADINLLLIILNALVDAGNTVVIIEHNMDVIEAADYIIDLGPEGGDLGGEIVCVGTPEQVAACPESYTGQFLRQAGN